MSRMPTRRILLSVTVILLLSGSVTEISSPTTGVPQLLVSIKDAVTILATNEKIYIAAAPLEGGVIYCMPVRGGPLTQVTVPPLPAHTTPTGLAIAGGDLIYAAHADNCPT
jgi:hypothetical protein